MVKFLQTVTVLTLSLLLFFNEHVLAGDKDKLAPKHEIDAMLGAGILPPLDITEIGGSNLQRKYSWMSDFGIGYAHRIYNGLSIMIGHGVSVYNYKYHADVVRADPNVNFSNLEIRKTQRFYCFYLSLSLSQHFILAEKMWIAEGGVKYTETPSLWLSYELGVEPSNGGTAKRFFGEGDFKKEKLLIYFLKIGTPLFKNTSRFALNIVYNYCPSPLGTGVFSFTNTTTDSYGTFNIKGSSIGIDLRYSFLRR